MLWFPESTGRNAVLPLSVEVPARAGVELACSRKGVARTVLKQIFCKGQLHSSAPHAKEGTFLWTPLFLPFSSPPSSLSLPSRPCLLTLHPVPQQSLAATPSKYLKGLRVWALLSFSASTSDYQGSSSFLRFRKSDLVFLQLRTLQQLPTSLRRSPNPSHDL